MVIWEDGDEGEAINHTCKVFKWLILGKLEKKWRDEGEKRKFSCMQMDRRKGQMGHSFSMKFLNFLHASPLSLR